MMAVAGWRTATCFTPAERAALALTEAVTRLSGDDPVPDEIWNEAARYYDRRVSPRWSCRSRRPTSSIA